MERLDTLVAKVLADARRAMEKRRATQRGRPSRRDNPVSVAASPYDRTGTVDEPGCNGGVAPSRFVVAGRGGTGPQTGAPGRQAE